MTVKYFTFLQLILFSQQFNTSQLFAQTKWYVDKNATGSNIGTSWENAWTSFNKINWNSIQPGDTVYISGGTTSKTYYEELRPTTSGTFGKNIVITKGFSSGHDGEVIIDAQAIRSYCIYADEAQFINYDGLTLNDATAYNVRIRADNNIVQNSKFYITFATSGIDIRAYNCHIKNNHVTTSATQEGGQRDFIQMTTKGNHLIEDNYVEISNPFQSAHTDAFQAYDMTPGTTVTIRNNFIWHNNTKTNNSQGLMWSTSGTPASACTLFVYNNIFYMPYGKSAINVSNDGGYNTILYAYNNTIYQGKNATGMIFRLNPPANGSIVKNNIIYTDHTPNFNFTGTTTDLVFENNLLFQPNGNYVSDYGGSKIFSEWNALSFVDDLYGDPLFNDLGNLDFGIRIGSPSIGNGANLSSIFTTDYFGNTRTNWTIGAIEYSSSSPDITAPKLINALINNSNLVTLTFSEALNPATAQNVNNYIIHNGVTVQSLVLSGSQVFLTTSDHSNGNYSIIANNVTDLAGNVIDPNFNSFNYQYSSVDTISPQLVSASVIDSITVDLYFSEILDPITSQNIANYTISDINISNALLSGNIVTLSTSIHSAGTYSVLVNNVTDKAENGIDLQYNSAIYEFQTHPDSTLLMFPVSKVNASVTPEPQHYAEKTIDGNGYYDGDPESRWTGDTMPEWLVYDLGNVQLLNSIKLSFYKWNEGRIYNYSIQVSSDSINWTTIKSDVSSSSEEWTIEEIGSLDARYIKVIFVSCNQLNWASLWEAEFWGQLKEPENPDADEEIPVTFNLEQNYPNPFNPSTRIKVHLPYSTKIKLTVYNMLGEFVSELADGEYEEGTYEFEFNALGLASGIYFYRIESSTFVESKKMVLLR